MPLFDFLRKNKKPLCIHEKKFGDPIPEKIKKIIEFKEVTDNFYHFKIYECQICGERFWVCSFFHFLQEKITNKVDGFIERRISLHSLIEMLDGEKLKYIVHKDLIDGYLKIANKDG